ncbi:MAG: lectin like domain-containing protein [Halobacteriota archaeon]
MLVLVTLSVVSVGIHVVPASAASPSLSEAPLNPEFATWQQSRAAGVATQAKTTSGHPLGGLPAPVDLSYTKGERLSNLAQASYPSSFDLRTQGKVTPVRDQQTCGACWAFSTYGSMESALLTAETRDFSENNLKNTHGFDYGPCVGGHAWMSAAYLNRWSGPVDESSDPYNPSSGTSPPNLPAQKHAQNELWVPVRSSSTDNDNIKAALRTYGAVDTRLWWTDTAYNTATASYYYNGASQVNHDITIVGWDDNYARSNFASQPPGNGAFIVKNSWGTSWGKSGYFYVSYYDTVVGNLANVVFLADPTTDYAKEYQYDPLGWVGSLGFGGTTMWMANIFTASASESLKAVSFYTNDVNAQYEVYVYTDPSSTSPTSGTEHTENAGTMATMGYHTVSLTTPVTLTPNGRFSVVVKLTNPSYAYPAVEERAESGYSSAATASAGQSFYSGDGAAWGDLTSYDSTANFCIKAFTDPQAGPPSTTLTITSPTGTPSSGATYTVAGDLRDSNNKPVANAPVDIYVDSSDTGAYHWWELVTTDANGHWSTTDHHTSAGVYYEARFWGDGSHAASSADRWVPIA